MKAYAIGGEAAQQALIRGYFEVYFNEGKDIGDVDLLGDLAAKVGFMTKDEVRFPLVSFSDQILTDLYVRQSLL